MNWTDIEDSDGIKRKSGRDRTQRHSGDLDSRNVSQPFWVPPRE